MDQRLKQAWGAALIAACLGAMLAVGQGGLLTSPWTPLFLAGLAGSIGLGIVRRTRRRRPNRAGAMTPRRRPPLTQAESAVMTSTVLQAIQSHHLKVKTTGNRPPPEDALLMDAVTTMRDSWNLPDDPDPAKGQDELRSTYNLIMFARTIDGTDADLQSRFLEDVADRAAFLGLRDRVLAARATARAEKAAYDAWRVRHRGLIDAGYKLADGWLPFVQAMPGKDFVLWHNRIADFHEIEGHDVLDGVFWMLAQPECDRATAAEFIRGFAHWHVLRSAADNVARGGDPWILDGYRAVIERWNAGFYRHATITPAPDHHNAPQFTQEMLLAKLAEASQVSGIPPFPEPVGVSDQTPRPAVPRQTRWRSDYDYVPGDGLILRYPGPDWATPTS